jgi:RNA polymerase sigma-70 factor (ECF subfamily)
VDVGCSTEEDEIRWETVTRNISVTSGVPGSSYQWEGARAALSEHFLGWLHMMKEETPGETRFADAWRLHRTHLIGLAFGMLGDIGAAEDAVQVAFSRLADSGFDRIEDERGWLTVVTSRICLDQIRSARGRHEQVYDVAVFEMAGGGPLGAAPVDPADRVTLDDEVRLALLVVLQRLSPAERVAFVLHDIFRLPFDAVGDTLGRPAQSCRQLAARARGKIEQGHPHGRATVSTSEHREVAEKFMEACASGDLATLIRTLDPDVTGVIDLGPSDPRSGQVFRGSSGVAANLLRYMARTTLVVNPMGGPTIVLAFKDRRLWAVVMLTVENGLITELDGLADPEKIGFLGSQLSAATP